MMTTCYWFMKPTRPTLTDFHLLAREVKFLLDRVGVKISPSEPRGETRSNSRPEQNTTRPIST